MKNKILKLIAAILLLPASTFAQLETLAERTETVVKEQARIKTSNKKPFWIGVGTIPSIHFDSTENRKVGLGTFFKNINSVAFGENRFFEHAKLHIRHEGGTGSEFNTQKGPHLLLDEASDDRPAVLRFRQSTIVSEGSSVQTNSLQIGVRYWDLRGFANGSSLNSDEFRLINSGASEDLMTIDGDGNFKFSGEGNTRLEIKGPSSNNPVKIEFGAVGEASNGGRIWYNTGTENLQLFSGGVRGLEIDGNGFVQVGSGSSAPSIKTYLGSMVLSETSGVTTLSSPLPFEIEQIIGVNLTLINWANQLVGSSSYVNASHFEWWVEKDTEDEVQLYVSTEAFTGYGAQGQTLKYFITYVE